MILKLIYFCIERCYAQRKHRRLHETADHKGRSRVTDAGYGDAGRAAASGAGGVRGSETAGDAQTDRQDGGYKAIDIVWKGVGQ